MTDTPPTDRDLVVRFAPAPIRPALAALFALDHRLADIVRTTREPLVGQMRLTWWHDALCRLDTASAPAEPLLQAVQRDILPHGVAGADLARLTEGWETLLDPIDASVLAAHATLRGGQLFTLAGRLLSGESDQLSAAGEGWALADLATHLTLDTMTALARESARPAFTRAFAKSWPRSLRPIGALALLSRLALDGTSPTIAFARLTRFRITGR